MEKPSVNCDPEKNVTKDGIHIIIGCIPTAPRRCCQQADAAVFDR
jgi:hypothetical protein